MEPITLILLGLLSVAGLGILGSAAEEGVAAVRGRPSPRELRRRARRNYVREHVDETGVPPLLRAIVMRLAKRVANPPERRALRTIRKYIDEVLSDTVEDMLTLHQIRRAERWEEWRQAQEQAQRDAEAGEPMPESPVLEMQTCRGPDCDVHVPAGDPYCSRVCEDAWAAGRDARAEDQKAREYPTYADPDPDPDPDADPAPVPVPPQRPSEPHHPCACPDDCGREVSLPHHWHAACEEELAEYLRWQGDGSPAADSYPDPDPDPGPEPAQTADSYSLCPGPCGTWVKGGGACGTCGTPAAIGDGPLQLDAAPQTPEPVPAPVGTTNRKEPLAIMGTDLTTRPRPAPPINGEIGSPEQAVMFCDGAVFLNDAILVETEKALGNLRAQRLGKGFLQLIGTGVAANRAFDAPVRDAGTEYIEHVRIKLAAMGDPDLVDALIGYLSPDRYRR